MHSHLLPQLRALLLPHMHMQVRHRRACLRAYDASSVALLTLVMSLGFAQPALAYVDPSVMTYTIQALAGVAIALSTVLGVALRRTRKHLLKLLGIDENAGKLVEPDVHRINPATGEIIENSTGTCKQDVTACNSNDDASVETGVTSETEGEGTTGSDGRATRPNALPLALRWRSRLVYAFIAAAFFALTIFAVAPLEIVAGSESSLVFGLRDVWIPVVLTALALTGILAVLISLFRGKAFRIAIALVFGLGLAAYVQALFLNTGLPVADGKAVDWGAQAGMMVVSGIVWIGILIACLLPACGVTIPRTHNCSRKSRTQRSPQRALVIMAAVSICLLVVQTVGVASLFISPASKASKEIGGTDGLHTGHHQDDREAIVTEDGLFEVSPNGNVIVFVLDTFDTREFTRLIQEYPELTSELDGFTLYEDSVGSMVPTRYAVPFLLTGELPHANEPFSTYLRERYARSSFLADVDRAGYSIGIYSDTLGLEYVEDTRTRHDVTEKTINIHGLDRSGMSTSGTLLVLAKCALYRDTPWVAKPLFWFYTDEVNGAMIAHDPSATPAQTVYAMDDAAYFERLQQIGLAATDKAHGGAFRFIHLAGAHYPYSMDENAQFIGLDNSTQDRQARGTMHIVDEYLRQLKDLGLYDAATIIITADHGEWYITQDVVDRVSSPIMLVKRPTAGRTIAAENPLFISNAPVSHSDFQPTVLEAVGVANKTQGGKHDAGGNAQGERTEAGTSTSKVADVNDAQTGISLLGEVSGKARTRYYYMTTSDGAHDARIEEYRISGNALDLANWARTSTFWMAQE